MDDDKLFESDPTDEQEGPRLKVTDRRKFDRDGNPIAPTGEDADSGEPVPDDGAETAEPVPEDSAETTESVPDTGAAAEEAEPADAGDSDEPRIAAPAPSMADLPRNFSAFVETMYLEAMLYLGAIADPRSGEVIEDIELAKYKIDLLAMLQGKTEGNLTVEERQQVEEVLYQLRMIYLQKSKAVELG